MNAREDQQKIIEETGRKYEEIIFKEDFIPGRIYTNQIELRNRIIRQTLNGKKFSTILDLGCGTGFHLATLGKFSDNLIGIDMSYAALKKCREISDGDYIVCDVRHLPFKSGTIDCIWTAGVLHHVPDDLEGIIGENIVRILRRGGLFLVDEPNKLNPATFFIIKFSKADPTGEERALSASAVTRALVSSNMAVISVRYYELFSPFGFVLKSDCLVRVSGKIDLWLSTSVLARFLLRWTIYAKKC